MRPRHQSDEARGDGSGKDFSDMYARAREERSDVLAREILEIADAPYADQVAVQRARNRIDTRKWLAAKLAPRKYGDRVEHDVKGGIVFQPAVLVQVGSIDQPMKTISDPVTRSVAGIAESG
jgi:hypothetical protein